MLGVDAGGRDSVQMSTPEHLERLQEMGAKRIRIKPKRELQRHKLNLKKRPAEHVNENRYF